MEFKNKQPSNINPFRILNELNELLKMSEPVQISFTLCGRKKLSPEQTLSVCLPSVAIKQIVFLLSRNKRLSMLTD